MDSTKIEKIISEFEKKISPRDKDTGRLRYLYGGSFALNALAYLDSKEITLCSKGQSEKAVKLSKKAQDAIKRAKRKIHDIDIAVLDKNLYDDLEENDLEDKYKIDISSEELSDTLELFTGVFRKYPQFYLLNHPEKAQNNDEKILVIDRYDSSSKCPDEFAIISINGREIKISSPKDLLSYKIPFALRQVGDSKLSLNYDKNKNNLNDLIALQEIASELYSREELEENIANKLIMLAQEHQNDGITIKEFEKYYDKFTDFSNNMITDENKESIENIQELISNSLRIAQEKQYESFKPNEISKKGIISIASEDEVVLENENATEDIQQLNLNPDKLKAENQIAHE